MVVQNGFGRRFLRYNDPVLHKPNFFKALVVAVDCGHIPRWRADELRRSYNADL